MEWMFMPLKRYAEFSGRSRRMEYWMFVVFQMLLGIAFWILMLAVGGTALMSGNVNGMMAAGGAMMIVFLLYCLVGLALIIPAIAVGVRRLHDTNRTGWWLLAPLGGYVIMFIGTAMAAASPDAPGAGGILAMMGGLFTLVMGIVLFVFLLLDGTRGPNRFGEDPKGPAHQEVFA
jgi:uncharacterized membrane protein YhaH (DUF805 family)